MNQGHLDQIREEAIRFCLQDTSSRNTSPERLDEWARRTEFERLETTAQIEARIKDLEAAIETRFDLYTDKKKRNLLPPYYSDEDRREKDRQDREEIDRLKQVLLYRANRKAL